MTIQLRNFGGGEAPFYAISMPPPATDTIAMNTDNFSDTYDLPYFPGFYGNGDYFRFSSFSPTSNELQYYNSNNTLIWSLSQSDISASSNRWIGITLDRTAELVYVVVYYSGTSSIGYLSSINPGGTIVTNGVTLSSNTSYMGLDSSLTQSPTDPNKLIIRYKAGSYYYEITVNKDGSSRVQTSMGSINRITTQPLHKTSNGIYHGSIKGSVSIYGVQWFEISNLNVTRRFYLSAPYSNFPYYIIGTQLLEWGDHYVPTASSGMSEPGTHVYNKSEYDAWIDAYAVKLGLL